MIIPLNLGDFQVKFRDTKMYDRSCLCHVIYSKQILEGKGKIKKNEIDVFIKTKQMFQRKQQTKF